MERAVLVYTTWPSVVEAEQAGRQIVERRLAACVNILPGMISHYWWQGKIESSAEVLIIFKAAKSKLKALEKLIVAQHPYDMPEFLALPLAAGNGRYLAWLAGSLKSQQPT